MTLVTQIVMKKPKVNYMIYIEKLCLLPIKMSND